MHRRQEALQKRHYSSEPPQIADSRAGDTNRRHLAQADGVSVTGRLSAGDRSLAHRERLVVTGPTVPAVHPPERAEWRPAARYRAVRRPEHSSGLPPSESELPPGRRASDVFQLIASLISAGELSDSKRWVYLNWVFCDRGRRAKIGDLSMGQRRRLDLALILAQRPRAPPRRTHKSSPIALVDDSPMRWEPRKHGHCVFRATDNSFGYADWPLLDATIPSEVTA